MSGYSAQTCNRCGTQNQPGTSYCSLCAADLSVPPQPAPELAQHPVAGQPIGVPAQAQLAAVTAPSTALADGRAAPQSQFAGYQQPPGYQLLQVQLGQFDGEIARTQNASALGGVAANLIGAMLVSGAVFFGSLFSAMISFAACAVALVFVGALLRAISRILGAWWNSFWFGFLIAYWAAYIGGLAMIVGDSAFFGGKNITGEEFADKELTAFLAAVLVAALVGTAVFLIRKERVRASLVKSLQSQREALIAPTQPEAIAGPAVGVYGAVQTPRAAPKWATTNLKGWQSALIVAAIFLLPLIAVLVVLALT